MRKPVQRRYSMHSTYQAKLLCEGFVFPESPRWHRGHFYCNSIDEGTIFKIHEDGSKEVMVKIDDWLSGWAFTDPDSDDIVLTSALQRKVLVWDGKNLDEFTDLSEFSKFAINDLIRTHNGAVFVDVVDFEFGKVAPEDMPMNPIVRVSPDGQACIATNVTGFPNGMVVSPDGNRLIVADSTLCCLHEFDLDGIGELSNHRLFASTPGFMLDGITQDRDGGIWVAAGHKGVFRVVEGGEVTDKVDIGETGATACMLGGHDGRTLLITASDSHDRNIIRDNPSGRLYTARVDVPGAGLPSWYDKD